MNKKYFVRPLQGAQETQMLAVVYNGEYIDNTPAMVELTGDGMTLTGQISSYDTSVILGPIASSTKYQMSIVEACATYEANFSTDENSAIVSFNSEDNTVSSFLTQPAADVTYQVYASGSSTLAGTYASLFEAINKARTLGNKSTVKMNGIEVFCYGVAQRYYKYQYTAAYGYTTDPDDADWWLQAYWYSYVVPSSDARIRGANYQTIKGTAPSWALEPNSGGYYYQYSNYQINYQKVSMRVNLSEAQLHLSENSSQPFVAYVFINVHNSSQFYDLGLVFNNTDHIWRTRANPETNVVYEGDRDICKATLRNGVWTANGDVSIIVETTSSGLKATIKNISTGSTGTIIVTNSGLCNTSAGRVFVPAVSYVPDLDKYSPVTPDFRCGGYFKNVQLKDCRIYNASGVQYSFFAGSTATDMSLMYNTDCCEVTAGTALTTVNIAYNRPYTT